jgi:copper chaperone CopZ
MIAPDTPNPTSTKEIGMTSKTWIVDGMTCGHCVASVTAEVGKLPGVSDVQVDLATKRVVVTGGVPDDAVVAAVDEAGYDAVPA